MKLYFALVLAAVVVSESFAGLVGGLGYLGGFEGLPLYGIHGPEYKIFPYKPLYHNIKSLGLTTGLYNGYRGLLGGYKGLYGSYGMYGGFYNGFQRLYADLYSLYGNYKDYEHGGPSSYIGVADFGLKTGVSTGPAYYWGLLHGGRGYGVGR